MKESDKRKYMLRNFIYRKQSSDRKQISGYLTRGGERGEEGNTREHEERLEGNGYMFTILIVVDYLTGIFI